MLEVRQARSAFSNLRVSIERWAGPNIFAPLRLCANQFQPTALTTHATRFRDPAKRQ
jgi:hypothetical protein